MVGNNIRMCVFSSCHENGITQLVYLIVLPLRIQDVFFLLNIFRYNNYNYD